MAFDERFRGSPEVVRHRLEIYRDLVDLPAAGRLGPAVDLGCGRGEWLDLLRDLGISGYGVDDDPVAVAAVRGRGHRVEQGDLLGHLEALPAGSLGLVTLFHVAEHLTAALLLTVLGAARRALAAGGVLIVETPNPRNLVMGAANFYIDPTHLRPLPPELLAFLAEAAGFVEVVVHGINPPAVPPFTVAQALTGDPAAEHLVVELNRWLHGPLDSALVARRGSD